MAEIKIIQGTHGQDGQFGVAMLHQGQRPVLGGSQGHRPGSDMSIWSSAYFPQLLEGDALRITDAALLGWLKEGDLFGTLLGWEKAGEGAIARTPDMASRQKH